MTVFFLEDRFSTFDRDLKNQKIMVPMNPDGVHGEPPGLPNYSGIRQVSPVCTLLNMFPWVHSSPRRKQLVHRFSRFCTVHGRVSSGCRGMSFPLKIDPWYGSIWTPWPPSNTGFLGLTRVHTPSDISIGSAVLQGRRTWTVQSYSPGCANVYTHVTHACLGPPESTTQTASRLVKPFLHCSRQRVAALYNGPHVPPKIAPCHGNLNPM